MAEALRDAGVEAAFYKREGVFQSDEALDFLNLLKAIADPGDPSLRAKAWITPAFGVALDHLAACRDLPESHPLLERLRGWHGLAKEGRMADLYREILGGGLLRRLLRTEPDDRSAGIWMQLAEFALEQGEGHPGGFEETVRRFGDYVEGRAQPPGEDADVHRMKSDRPAVQILTMHKAKGLEAAVVAVFGGFSEGRPGAVHHFFDGAARRFWVGLQPSPQTRRRARQESEEESQRLLYVALTRAKAQLILPVFEGTGSGSFHKETGDPKGVYGVLNRRLRALLPNPEPGLFAVEDVDLAPVRSSSPALPLEDGPGIDIPQRPDFGILAAAARPVRTVSFTSLSRELNDHARPDSEERRSSPENERPALPGGAEVGTCLHSILERVPLASAAEAGSLEAWMARGDIAEILGSALRKSLLEPRHLRELARLCFGALTQRYPLPGGGALEGLAGVARAEREVDFLLPHPDGVDFLEGSIDLLFEWQGKAYFADWKSNLLPAYDADSCKACLREKYDLQFRIYTLAACGFLGIQDQAAYEARFGGGLYVFLRGLPEGGLASDRPGWPQVMAWRREISAMGEEWTDAVL
jgi:exodeoxyribonuclease V beta subunit